MDRGGCAYKLMMLWAMRGSVRRPGLRRRIVDLFAVLRPAKA